MYMTGALTAGRRLIAYPQDTSGVRNLTGSSEPATGVTRVGPAARRAPRRRPSPPRLSGPCRAVLRGYALALVLAPLAPPRRQPSAQIPCYGADRTRGNPQVRPECRSEPWSTSTASSAGRRLGCPRCPAHAP